MASGFRRSPLRRFWLRPRRFRLWGFRSRRALGLRRLGAWRAFRLRRFRARRTLGLRRLELRPRTLELRRFRARRRAFRLRRFALRRLTLRALEAGGAPFRHELKFLVTRGEGFALSSRFSALFARDGHAGADGRYEVHSLYFDTPDDRALREKLYGLRDKEKFRLRYYGEDVSFVRLEKKIKRGELCAKFSAVLPEGGAEALLAGRADFLLESDEPLFAEFYAKLRGGPLRPSAAVSYSREAFVYAPGGVRVNIDRDLRRCLDAREFLNPRRFGVPADGGFDLLEVKYGAFLPDVARMAVQTAACGRSAFSKYAECRRFE